MSNKPKMNILRTVLCAVALCALMAAMLFLFHGVMDTVTQRLEEIDPKKDGDMKNTLWLIEKILYVLPVCVLLIFQTVFYLTQGNEYASVRYRERAWELIVAFVFTYAILLPAIVIYSNNNPPLPDAETGEETLSLIARSVQWFVWQILIFLPAILYHRVMATGVKDEDNQSENEGKEIEQENN